LMMAGIAMAASTWRKRVKNHLPLMKR
jgi:hypothetical protein